MITLSKEFENINYQRVISVEEVEGENESNNDVPPAVVTMTKGTEDNSQWNHIENLDQFFTRIYKYHREQGFSSLLLSRIFGLIQYAFVVLFATFLTVCVDYKQLFDDPHPSFTKSIDWHNKVENMSPNLITCLVVAFVYWAARLAKVIHQTFKAWQMRNFYNSVLNITDSELQNILWSDVQKKLIEAQKVHQISIQKEELSELDIHHRILRQKNYFIALQNKGVMSFVFDFPLLGKFTFLTEGLKFNLNFLLFKGPGSPFDNKWKLNAEYKDYNSRITLADALSRRIILLGLVNLLFCPFIMIYQILRSFFTYAEMLKRSPDTFGVRKWSQYGRIFLRHFNELEHEFQDRLCKAYEASTKYMNSFSSPLLVIVSRNVAFFAGAVLAVLLALSFYDADVLTAEHVISSIAILGVIVKVATGFIPDENTVFCPAGLMREILSYVHYIPDRWKGRAHTKEVREEFSNLFHYKSVHLIEELVSPVLTPFILCFFIRFKSLEIVDFFRNFTVEVADVGDVCSFALMDLHKHGDKRWSDNSDVEETTPEQQAENGKIGLSLLHFTIRNPTWNPTNIGKQFIEVIREQAIKGNLSMPFLLSTVSAPSFIHKNLSEIPSSSQELSLLSLAKPSVLADVHLKLQETIMETSTTSQEANEIESEQATNSSMLFMHALHDTQSRVSASKSSSDITKGSSWCPKTWQSFPPSDEPAIELTDLVSEMLTKPQDT